MPARIGNRQDAIEGSTLATGQRDLSPVLIEDDDPTSQTGRPNDTGLDRPDSPESRSLGNLGQGSGRHLGETGTQSLVGRGHEEPVDGIADERDQNEPDGEDDRGRARPAVVDRVGQALHRTAPMPPDRAAAPRGTRRQGTGLGGESFEIASRSRQFRSITQRDRLSRHVE